jgi:hypothetical protein
MSGWMIFGFAAVLIVLGMLLAAFVLDRLDEIESEVRRGSLK